MTTTLVLGIGNSLQADDGVGVHVIHELEKRCLPDHITLCDGGTIGLSLLAEIEQCSALIVIDAMKLGAQPGTMRVFEGDEIERQLNSIKRTAHEVAVSDLLAAARLTGSLPEHRALIGIQPGRVGWGLEPEGPVAEAVPHACAAVLELSDKWCANA